ncbi:MAG: phage tail protein [Roseiflexaceae bacterium]
MTTSEAFSNCRFYVEIDQKKTAVFTEVGGIQIETTLQDYEEGGNNGFVRRFPTRTKVGNLTLKRGMVASNELFKWYEQTIQGKAVRRNVSVIMYDSTGTEICRWDFENAFPVKWVGPQFTADGKNLAVETIELAHDGIKLQSS